MRWIQLVQTCYESAVISEAVVSQAAESNVCGCKGARIIRHCSKNITSLSQSFSTRVKQRKPQKAEKPGYFERNERKVRRHNHTDLWQQLLVLFMEVSENNGKMLACYLKYFGFRILLKYSFHSGINNIFSRKVHVANILAFARQMFFVRISKVCYDTVKVTIKNISVNGHSYVSISLFKIFLLCSVSKNIVHH